MAKKYIFFGGGFFLCLAAWLFVGLDRYVGDHEVESGWSFFVKAYPAAQIFYKNPAQYTLDRDPFDSLDGARKIQFLEYCSIRHGIQDPHQCEKYIDEKRVK